jgi:hypothetical protein
MSITKLSIAISILHAVLGIIHDGVSRLSRMPS